MSNKIIAPTRGRWHRRTERGSSLPSVAGARHQYVCSFCDKAFATEQGVRAHERSYHEKALKEHSAPDAFPVRMLDRIIKP